MKFLATSSSLLLAMMLALFTSLLPTTLGFASASNFNPAGHTRTSLSASAPKQDASQLQKVVIAGAGPCGLYLAGLLLQQDANCRVTILEKLPRTGKPGNAFGMGLSPRLIGQLQALPGLEEKVMSVGRKVDRSTHKKPVRKREKQTDESNNNSSPSPQDDNDNRQDFEFRIASRQNICEQMMQYLEEAFVNDISSQRLQVRFEDGCAGVDFDAQRIVTERGNCLNYDLLVAADGVNSLIRRQLVQTCPDLEEEHYLNNLYWKSLELPYQPMVKKGAFQRVKHPHFWGQLLPRYPDGHIALLFYPMSKSNSETSINPEGIDTIKDLQQAMNQAVLSQQQQAKQHTPSIRQRLRRLVGKSAALEESKATDLLPSLRFNATNCEDFLTARPGRSHYMKLNQYHSAPHQVALIGDAAHGMYSLLGQGCACGLENTHRLAQCLQQNPHNIPAALEAYSQQAVPEGHAITDLNLVAYVLRSGIVTKLRALPTMLWQSLTKKGLFQRLGRPDVSYSQLLRENKRLVRIAEPLWKKRRQELPASYFERKFPAVAAVTTSTTTIRSNNATSSSTGTNAIH